MYLSQLVLNAQSREVRREHRTPYETHRSVMSAFPKVLPEDERVLFRRETLTAPPAIRVLVQSIYEPDWSHLYSRGDRYLLAEPQVKVYDPAIAANAWYTFRLLANPTIKRDGRRLGLLQEDDQWQWLVRKGENAGFQVERKNVRITQHGFVQSTTRAGNRPSHFAVQYDGLLQVTHGRRFYQGLREGIGPAKGMGFGLLSIAPPSSF